MVHAFQEPWSILAVFRLYASILRVQVGLGFRACCGLWQVWQVWPFTVGAAWWESSAEIKMTEIQVLILNPSP